MDWFAGPSQDEESLQFAAKQDATPKRWLVVTADGKGALVSAEGVTVRCGAMFKQVAYSAETGLPVPEAPAPVEPPLEFIWWRTGERYFVRLASLFGSESTEATLSGGRLMTTSWDGSPSWVLKRDPHPPAGVERRLRGEPSPVSASPPSFWDIPE